MAKLIIALADGKDEVRRSDIMVVVVVVVVVIWQ